jgi:glycerophosphoryl diester phosphodiesterase
MTENPDFRATREDMQRLAGLGLNTLAPPIWALLEVAEDGDIVPSEYARLATAAGLEIVTWTLERSGPLRDGGGWYYQTLSSVIDNDGQAMEVLDVLATKVGIKAIFSDWPATATYYANCMGLE